MSRDGTLILLLVAQFLAPFVLVLLLGRRSDQPMAKNRHHDRPPGRGPGIVRNPAAPHPDDWPMITEFTYRRDTFKRWVLAAVFSTAVLALAGFYLTAIGVILLFPLYGALAHLRCPRCDSATTLKGVTDGHHCLRCGQRLRY